MIIQFLPCVEAEEENVLSTVSISSITITEYTPRITLSENTLQRLKDEDLEFSNYRDFSTKEIKERLEPIGEIKREYFVLGLIYNLDEDNCLL